MGGDKAEMIVMKIISAFLPLIAIFSKGLRNAQSHRVITGPHRERLHLLRNIISSHARTQLFCVSAGAPDEYCSMAGFLLNFLLR